MYFGNALHQCALLVPKCGGIGREGFLCILFKNKVGEILSIFFFIFEYQKIGKKLAKLVKFTLKKKFQFFFNFFCQEKNNESYTYK